MGRKKPSRPSRKGSSGRATQKISAVGRWREALELRLSGMSYREIAKQLGYKDHSSARYGCERALEETLQEPADELRKLESQRLDRLLAALWPKSEELTPFQRPAPKSKTETWRRYESKESKRVERLSYRVDRILKICKRRAQLLGLDSPVRHEILAEEITHSPVADRLLEDPDYRRDYFDLLERASKPRHVGVRDASGSGNATHPGVDARSAPPHPNGSTP